MLVRKIDLKIKYNPTDFNHNKTLSIHTCTIRALTEK